MTIKEFKVQYALGVFSYHELLSMSRNRHTKKGVLKILSNHPKSNIRYCVARNFNTPTKIFQKLVRDSDWDISYAALCSLERRIREEKTAKEDRICTRN